MDDACSNCALRHNCTRYDAYLNAPFNEELDKYALWCINHTKEK